MITTKQAGKIYEIAEIRVWSLIRKNLIAHKTTEIDTCVDEKELSKYFTSNPEELTRWRNDFNHTQTSISNAGPIA